MSAHSNVEMQYKSSEIRDRSQLEIHNMITPYIRAPKYNDPRRILREISCFLFDMKGAFGIKICSPASEPGYLGCVEMSGILPTLFNGKVYSTPVSITLLNQYPYTSPILRVLPTDTIVFNPKCVFIDPQGRAVHDYLHRWSPTSSLSEFVTLMTSAFGSSPPLVLVDKKPPVASGVPMNNTHMNNARPPLMNMHGKGNTNPTSQQPQYNPNPTTSYNNAYPAQPPYTTPLPSKATPQPASSTASPQSPPDEVDLVTDGFANEKAKKEYLEKLLHIKLNATYKKLATEFDDSTKEKSQFLRGLESELQTLREAQQKKNANQTHIKSVLDNATIESQKLKAWLDAYGSREPEIVCINSQHEQVLSALADDKALETTMEVIRELLKQRRISLETYLGYIRSLSMKQFNARALALTYRQQ